MILYKNVPGKSPLIVENLDRNKGCLQTWTKRGLILKTPLPKFNMKMHRRKIHFMKTSKTWPYFPKTFFYSDIFLQDFNSCDFISVTLLEAPILFWEKSPRNLKPRTLYSVTFCPRISENRDFLSQFLFPGFYQEIFFLWLSYIDLYSPRISPILPLFNPV